MSTPIAAKFAEWQAATHAADNVAADVSDADLSALTNRAFDLADELVDMPSECPADFIRKLVAYTFDGQHDVSDGAKAELIWQEARTMVAAC